MGMLDSHQCIKLPTPVFEVGLVSLVWVSKSERLILRILGQIYHSTLDPSREIFTWN
jgi:hypothetical protein